MAKFSTVHDADDHSGVTGYTDLLDETAHDALDHTGLTGVGGGGGIDSGTSFPGSPSDNDLFYHETNDLLYFYDGTRWLTTTLYEHHLGTVSNVTGTVDIWTAVWAADYDQYLVDWRLAMNASGLSGSAYWIADLYTPTTALGSVVATLNNSTSTSNETTRHKGAIGALLGTNKNGIVVEFRKTGSPGGLWAGGILTYRLVGA